jgi:hypothetical protein
VFLVSTGSYGAVLTPFVYAKGSLIKLPKFEVDLPLPLNLNKYRYNAESATRYYLNESDVLVARIYNEFYVMVIRQMAAGSDELPKQAAARKVAALGDKVSSKKQIGGYKS